MPVDIFSSPDYATFKSRLIASHCSKCPALCKDRHNIVVDRGNPDTKLMVIGEAPGENEDLQGKAFVGRGGKLLDKLMASVGIDTNKDLLIVNVVKCRPPNNRPPKPEEVENCKPYLRRQMDFVSPDVVVLLGATAVKHIFPDMKGMKERVGRFFDSESYPGRKFFLLYHPAYLLRDPRKQPDTLEHLKSLKKYLDAKEDPTYESTHR